MQAKRTVEAPTDPVLTPRLVLTPAGPDDVDDLSDGSLVGRGGFTRFDLDGECDGDRAGRR